MKTFMVYDYRDNSVYTIDYDEETAEQFTDDERAEIEDLNIGETILMQDMGNGDQMITRVE